MSVSTDSAAASWLDPYDPATLLDPYPYYARLREAGSAIAVPSRDMWLVPRYADAVAVLRNHREFVSGDGVTYRDPGERDPFPLIETDPPEHNRIRSAVQPSFSSSAIEEMRPALAEQANAIVDRALVKQSCDAVPDLAEPMPDQAMKMLTGLMPPSQRDAVDWADAVVRAQEPLSDQTEHFDRVLATALEWISTDGLVDIPAHCLARTILQDGGAHNRLVEQGPERLMTLASIWLAGIESTAALIGNAVDAFIEHPDQWDLLRRNPDLIPNAVEELLRYEAPFRVFFRRTRTEVALGDTTIPAGARVSVMLASANRDAAQFADPDTFDITRSNAKTHLAFSTAVHQCLGSPLARLEGQCMLAALVERVARFERSGDSTRDPSGTVRKFSSLPVRLVADGGSLR